MRVESHEVVSESLVTPWTVPGSSVHGVLQAILKQAAISYSTVASSRPRDQTHIPCTVRRVGSLPL